MPDARRPTGLDDEHWSVFATAGAAEDAQPADDRQGAEPISPSTWECKRAPARQWLVRDWVPAGRVTGLMGRGGVGKSLVAQQLQTAAAIGRPWLGLHVTQVRSLGVYCEDERDELHRRQESIARCYDARMTDLDAMLLWPRVGCDSRLAIIDPRGELTLTTFFDEVRRRAASHGARLLILDNAGDLFTLNQNDDVHARLAVNAVCGRLARELDATVLLLRHPSRAGMTTGDGDAGSVAWTNSFRARIYLDYEPAEGESEPDKLARVLSHRKSNYGAQADDLRLRWEHGAFIRADAPTDFVGSIDKRARERDADETFLACLQQANARGQHASDQSASRDRYAPKLFRSLEAGRAFSARELKQAMDRLLDAKKIRVESVRNANRNYVSSLVIVAP